MTQRILDICTKFDFEKLFKEKGYAYFKNGHYNLNIIGIRADSNSKCTNTFDDALVVIYKDDSDRQVREIYSITTDPGKVSLLKPIGAKGCAILVEGQYRSTWRIGYHQNKYRALVQDRPVKVYRDNNKDMIYDFNKATIEEGRFGINIHKAGAASKQVDNWSAGCQVFANNKEFERFMTTCDKQVENGYGITFTYTLLNEKDCKLH